MKIKTILLKNKKKSVKFRGIFQLPCLFQPSLLIRFFWIFPDPPIIPAPLSIRQQRVQKYLVMKSSTVKLIKSQKKMNYTRQNENSLDSLASNLSSNQYLSI